MAAASLDELRWRSSLPHGRDVPGPDDLRRAGDVCAAEGFDAEAGMLRRIAEVIEGFSPQRIALRAGAALPAGDTGTVTVAIAELQAFARAAAPGIAQALADAPVDRPNAGGSTGDVAGLAAELHGFFADPSPLASGDMLVMRLDDAGRRGAAIDYRRLAGSALSPIASAMALAAAQQFALANRSLLRAPLGGAALAHRAARFDDAGLGPYFGNVRRIAGRSRDVFELAAVARRAGLEAGGDVPAVQWAVLIAQHLDGALRDEIVDDLGDLGAMAALAAMLDRAVAPPDHRIETDLVMRLRDAALDNGDPALGARAQAVIARLRPDSMLERQLLGEIDATAGHVAAAEQSFLACLRNAPGDAGIVERLAALKARRFAPFEVKHGWGTPPDRLATRLRRRQGRGGAIRIETRRAATVEF